MAANPEVALYCNQRARPSADRAVQTYYFAKEVIQEWYANNMASLIPPTDDVIDDGSATDGRHPVTGNDINNLITLLSAYVADMEANSGAALNVLLNTAVNPLP